LKNCILGPAFPLRGGIANFNEALCRAFNQAGIASHLISFSLQYPGFLFPGSSQFESGAGPDDLKIEVLVNSVNPITWFKTALSIRKQQPDYVVVRYWLPFMAPCLGTIARLIKYKTAIKIIAIADNIVPHEKRAGDKLLTKYFIKPCDAFVVMSKAVMGDLKGFSPLKPVVFIPHPVYDIFGSKVSKSAARGHLKIKQEDRLILFFGFIRHYKGLDLLLKAMAEPMVKALGIKLIVAGEFYEDANPYNKLINDLELQDRVILHTHYIPKEDVKYYFCAADLIAQPYHTATQSGVTQIAYHFERPMLVTNVGGLAEIVPDGKVGYVTEKDSKAIGEALSDFYNNDREVPFSSFTATEKKKFSWENMVMGIQDLFLKL
jgi:D-inositol-3-phosphate glycosyltransferase